MSNKRGAQGTRIARRKLPMRGTRGRKRMEDATVRFLKNGKVIVSVPGKMPLVSRRLDPIGSTMWFLLHILGLSACDDEDFLISAQRTRP